MTSLINNRTFEFPYKLDCEVCKKSKYYDLTTLPDKSDRKCCNQEMKFDEIHYEHYMRTHYE